MALNRPSQRLLWLLNVLLMALASCAPPSAAVSTSARTVFADTPRRPDHDAVLVFLPESAHTREAWETLKDELGSDFDVLTRLVSPEVDQAYLSREIEAARPRGIVLMGNLAMNLYLDYQRHNPGKTFPPALVVMASFFEQQRALFRNTTGISYEIPGITTFVGLRSFVYHPVRRVGVIHRPLFVNYVDRQARLAAVEQVQIVRAEVGASPGPYEVRRALDRLIHRDRVDAVWVLNDNVLLEPELIAKGWLTVLHKNPTLVVVGVGSLVDQRLHFGSFAMLPDHAALGVQTANLVFKLSEHGWNADSEPVELPLAVQTVVDLTWTREHFDFREEALDRIDRIVR